MHEGFALEKEEERILSPEEEWLMATGHFKPLDYPSEDEVAFDGQDIAKHYKKIEPNVPEDNRWMLEALANYIEAPIIVDDFPSERERNAWQRAEIFKHPNVNELFERNKLKGNFIGNVLGIEGILDSEPWLDPEIKNKYIELYEEYNGPTPEISSAYEQMSIEEKIAYTKKVSDFAKDLYRELADRYARKIVKLQQ